MKHIIAVLLENEPGALSRVVGLFSARGYNIESLTVAPTEDASLSRMTIQTTGSDDVIEQITKHLNRLIEVVKVVDLTEGAYIERELMMVKVRAVGKEREEMKRMADIFRGRIIDVNAVEIDDRVSTARIDNSYTPDYSLYIYCTHTQRKKLCATPPLTYGHCPNSET